MKKFIFVSLALTLVFGSQIVLSKNKTQVTGGDMVTLGKLIFFDSELSANKKQSCSTCHAPEAGFTSPDSLVNQGGAVIEGAIPNHYGNRKPPASAYAGDSPILYFDEGKETWFGGMFWDGRATGWTLGDPLAEQALGPFVNPLEQAIANVQVLCVRVKNSSYATLFESVWGKGSLNCAKDANGVYEKIGRSIAAYERDQEVNPFTSKFDLFWENAKTAGKDITKITAAGIPGGMMGGGGMGGGGMGNPQNNPARWEHYKGLGLSDDELKGLAIFNDSRRGNCSSCHTLKPGSAGYPLFTDFSYHNLGIPKNPENPFYTMPPNWNPDGFNWVDYGLGDFLRSAGYEPEIYEPELGKFKTPTLRNVDLRPHPDFVKAYGHNGFFKSLDGMDGIIHFYAWRAMMDNGGMGGGGMGGGGMMPNPNLFPPPEFDQNRIIMNPFNFMMDGARIMDFLKTLSDGYFER